MIDIHSHILPGVDDGSKSLEESLEVLKYASNNGVTDIILTPHFVKGSKYNVSNKKKKDIFSELEKKVKKEKIKINIYLGNEIYIDKDIIKLFRGNTLKLNNSKYVLIEFSLTHEARDIEFVVGELISRGYVPVIAHPERYSYYYKNYDFFDDLIDKGCLLQGNIQSIYGKYGRKAKRMIKQFLKRDMLTFLASDIHSIKDDVYTKDINKKLLKIVKSEDKVDNLLYKNAKDIIKKKRKKS